MKERRDAYWERTWYFPYLRALVGAAMNANKSVALTYVTIGNSSVQLWAYSAPRNTKVPQVFVKDEDGEEWMLQGVSLNGACRSVNHTVEVQKPWYDEVFRVGKGSL